MGEASETAAVRDAFAALARALKRISVFRHARDQYAAYLEPALGSFRSLLGLRSSVTVAVEPGGLRLEGELVYSEGAREWGFCFRFHRDGVRSLTFRRGLGLEDLIPFAQVALAGPADERGHEDAVTELWKLDLVHISVGAISGYRMDEAAGGSMSQAIAEISARTQETIDRRIGEAAAETGQERPLWTEQQRKKGDPGNWADLARRAALTIIRIVEQDHAGWDLEALQEAFGRLTDEMLERGEPAALAVGLERARRIGGLHGAEFRLALGRKLAEPVRLEQAIAFCAERPALLNSWLLLLPPESGPAVVAALTPAAGAQSLQLLAQAALARLDSAAPPLGPLLRSGPAPTALAVLSAATALVPARRAALSVSALTHPDPAVQIAAVPLVAADPQVAIKQLGPSLSSGAREVRLAAAAAVASCAAIGEAGAALLMTAMSRPQFGGFDRDEQAAFHRALGKLASATGFSFLLERLARPPRGFFGRRKAEQDQLLAVQGLAEDTSQRSLRALEDVLLPSRGHPPAVVAACRAAAQHVRAAARGGRTA
jgi:hypothetical protein